MTPEGKVKKEIKQFLDSLGKDCWYFLPMMMGYGRKGIPDIIGCYGGLFFALEIKAEKGTPTPWQVREIVGISGSGGCVAVVYSVEDVRNLFSQCCGWGDDL